MSDLAVHLATVEHLFDLDVNDDRVVAVEAARAAGATWDQIAAAAGFSTRAGASTWYTRHR